MKRVVLALAALSLVPSLAFAQPDGQANLNVLLTSFDPGFCAGPFGSIDAGNCADLVAGAALPGPAFLWVVVSRDGDFNGTPASSVGGAQFGIQYDPSVLVQGWFLCTGGLEAPDPMWPQSGTGNAVTFANGCYDSPGTAAKLGLFILASGSGGPVGTIEDPRIPGSLWVDCGVPPSVPPTEFPICFVDGPTWPKGNHGGDSDLTDGTGPVCGDHCGGTPVEYTSWGAIKALF
jgi:hypothetical protein